MKAPLFAAVCAALVAFAAMPSPAAAQTSQTTAPATPGAKGKTAKECRAEWQANKADNQAKGITERAYVAQCRAGGTPAAAAPPAAPAPSQAPATTAAPAPAPAVPAARTSAPTGAGQFRSEAEAKGHCPADTVVWVNEKSHVYHFAGTHNYGATKQGAYMCEREAGAQGNRAAKNEKHP